MAGHWYRVEVAAGSETHSYFGRSALAEDEFMRRLQDGDYVALEELRYYDEEGHAQPWTEWDPSYLPRVYLNSRFVISVLPLNGDPRHRRREGSIVLNYPGPRPADDDDE